MSHSDPSKHLRRPFQTLLGAVFTAFILGIIFIYCPSGNDKNQNPEISHRQINKFVVCFSQLGKRGITDFFELPPLDITNGGCYGTEGDILETGILRYSYSTDRRNASRDDDGVIWFTACDTKTEECDIKLESLISGKYHTSGAGRIKYVRYSAQRGEWQGTYVALTSDLGKNYVGRWGRIVVKKTQ